MVDAAEPALGDDGDHVGRSSDPLFVGFGQRVGEAGLIVARDPHRRSAVGEYLIRHRRHAGERGENKQRNKAIERTVRIVRRLLRVRFLRTSAAYFT